MQLQSRTRKLRCCGLNVVSLRQSLIFQPLAVLLAILMLPALSWMESGGTGARPFQASAQIQLQGCSATGNTIIRNYCGNGVNYYTDLVQFENDSVSAYLALHNIPQSDAHVIYDYGRSDLRTAVRGVMMSTLQGIFGTPASQRTPHQQNLYNWMQGLVHSDEISMYQNALNSFHSWQSDPCHFALDPAIASTYNLSYDGNPYCFQSLPETDVEGAPVPAESYFTVYGLKKSYAAPGDTYSNFGSLVAATGVNVGEVAGVATAASTVLKGIAATLGIAVFIAFAAATAAYVGIGGGVAALALGPAILAGAAGLSTLAIVGAVLVPILCLIIGVVTIIDITQNEQAIADITSHLNTGLTTATNTQPDLNAMATDTSGFGFYKLELAMAGQTVPEIASTAALPTHQAADLNFAIGPTVATTLTYKDWNGNTRSAQTWGGWFVQTCANGTGSTCDQADSIIASIHYKDWSGVKWTASRMGSSFVNVKASPNSTDVPCPADSLTQVTPNPDPTKCSNYVSNSIQLEDGNGNKVTVSFSVLTPPVFTTPPYLSFVPGTASTQTIKVAGNPTPSVCKTSSNLPANITLNGGACGKGSFQLVFDGSSTVPVGDYQLQLTASGTGSPVSQTFAVSVKQVLAIVSPNSLSVQAGSPVNFLVMATGTPAPALSVDPKLGLGGMTFTDHGNGTATISGIWTAPESGPIQCFTNDFNGNSFPCGIIATNSQGTVEQKFTLNVTPAPVATITGCAQTFTCDLGTTFTAGVPNQVLLTSGGAVTPVLWSFSDAFPHPSWVQLKDNGNGTAVLSGMPPLGTTGPFTVGVMTSALGALGVIQNYVVHVVNQPLFTSTNTATFTVGTAGSFAVSANTGTISLVSQLPKGLLFATGNPAGISGVAASGTGGQYFLTVTDDAGPVGTATQTMTLNVNEAPQITSKSTANMFVGMPGSFAVTTIGFPSYSNHLLPPNPLPPTSPSQGEGMFFTVTGLPADLTFSNRDFFGFATGTLTIQGTPSAADVGPHQVHITSQNAVGQAAQQTLTLNIVQITGPAPTSGSTCNGNYNGTFTGNINVSSGQNCAFYGGGVNGNVSVNGGHIALSNSTVNGNVDIQGGSGFSVGSGTKILGTLFIQNVASGSTASQICQATVSGNVEISGNAIPIQIGNPQNSCFGSSFGKNVDISANTAAVTVYDNTVGNSLSCSGNPLITGAGNNAQKKGGQCAGF